MDAEGYFPPIPIEFQTDITELPEHETEPKKPPYTIRTVEWALSERPPTDWLVEGIFKAKSINAVVGEGGSGKTYALLDLAITIASGRPEWLGFAVKQAPVLFVDEESDADEFGHRVAEVVRGKREKEGIPFGFTNLENFNLREKNNVSRLHQAIVDHDARFVIIDALVDIMSGGDENATKDTQPILRALREIASVTNSCIVVIHHTNKTGGYRGSSAIKGEVNHMLLAERKTESNVLTFKTEKNRNAKNTSFKAIVEWRPGEFILSPADGSHDEIEIVSAKSERYVIRILRERGALFIDEIMDLADGCSPEAAKRAVYSLADRGITQRVNEGRKAQYNLTEKGRTCEL